MLANVDLANHGGPLLCYVASSDGGVHGTVTLLFKFAAAGALDGSCLKLRFNAEQFRNFQSAVANAPEFPGIDLAAQAWPEYQD
jgi:hypothetical protein